MSFQVKAEKMIQKPASDVFRALKEGLLFMNCSADSGSMQIDFRVGGKYRIDFRNKTLANFGEFLEIVPDKKIVFTWCQNFGPEQSPDTQVAIELFADGAKTRLVLIHTGFKTQEIKDNHQKGWDGGLSDFSAEIEGGQLRLVRAYQASAAQLFDVCKNPASFFAFMGDLTRGSVDFKVGGKYQVPTKTGEVKGQFLEIVPGKKITLSWLVGCDGPLTDSKVTLLMNAKEDGTSTLEIIHQGLHDRKEAKTRRAGWESITKRIAETVASGGRN